MRSGALLGLGFLVFAMTAVGCAAGNNNSTAGPGGSGGGDGGAGGGKGGEGGIGVGGGGNGQGGSMACAKFSAEATQAPAAILFAVDMSASMKKSSKWSTAQTSIVSAMDKDVFDYMTLGLVTFPTDFTDPPQCVCDYIEGMLGPGTCGFAIPNGVSCGYSGLPQVPMAPAGDMKSNAGMGVRSQIYQYLVSHSPLSNDDDGSPVYDAMVSGYNALKGQAIDRRVLILITDGGFSCTSLTNRGGYVDGYGCADWEYPSAVNQLITDARTQDPTKPIYTFVIGVPGSDSVGVKKDGFDTPPYHMKLALSTYAVSGSPDTIDPACSKDAVFDPQGADPAIPCHIDLSSASFNPDTLGNALQTIKGKALGCVYDLPMPPAGETIDKDYVNVDVTLDGATTPLKKRTDPADTCASDGCWDYNLASQVQILGKTCDDISKATTAKVDIKVGCQTVVK